MDIQCKIHALRELPPPPAAARQIVAAVMDEDLDLRKLSDLVVMHPTLTARIFGLARSAFFARGKPAATVKEAIIRVLGLRLVKCIAVAIAATGELHAGRCRSFDGERYWQRALTVAFMCRSLCGRVPGNEAPGPDDAYLQGLLCDFGLLALAHAIPLEMDEVFRAAEQQAVPIHVIELAQLEMSHAQAGSWLANRWDLPESACAVMAHYIDPDYRGDHWINSAIVGICTSWLDGLALGQPTWQQDTRIPALGISVDEVEQIGQTCLQKAEDVTQLSHVFAGN